MGTSQSKHYIPHHSLQLPNQAFLELVHLRRTSVLGTTETATSVSVPDDHLVVDPCSPGNAKSTSGAKGVSGAIYRRAKSVWGPIVEFTPLAKNALKHTGDGCLSTYGGRPLAQVVSPSFAWYKMGDVTWRHRDPTRHVVNRLVSAYTQAFNLFLSEENTTCRFMNCPPFAWGVNAGFWSNDLPILTLHALSETIGNLSDVQREKLRTTHTFNLCLYTAEEQHKMESALTATGMHLSSC